MVKKETPAFRRKTEQHLTGLEEADHACAHANLFRNVKRIVIKIGTSTLTGPDGTLDKTHLGELTEQVAELVRSGVDVIIVTSGAIGAGMGKLGLSDRPRSIPEKQATAAVGQCLLMQVYEDLFQTYGLTVGQLLLTRDDLTDRRRYLNARATLLALLDYGCIPVINENDTVAVDELRFGDNDTLSALVAGLVDAGLLIILSDVDGLYDRDPRTSPDAQLVPVIRRIDRTIEGVAGGVGSLFGTGGMATKVTAAKIATRSGVPVVIANGRLPAVVEKVWQGESIGTLFVADEDRIVARKRWIAFYPRPAGRLTVDGGAQQALVQCGKSLLPSGLRKVDGRFLAGDIVSVVADAGYELARGMVNYSSTDLVRIAGAKSIDIESLLGYKYADEVIHRDNLVLLSEFVGSERRSGQ